MYVASHTYVEMCVSTLLFLGSPVDIFLNLSVGLHTIKVQFIPDRHCQPLMDQLMSLQFIISMPSTVPPCKSSSARVHIRKYQ